MSNGNPKNSLIVGGSKGFRLEVVKNLLELGHSVHSIPRLESPLNNANLACHKFDVKIVDCVEYCHHH
jgi:short-subunit dehydrogenase involved in D-alanine esterification of teichoic acids